MRSPRQWLSVLLKLIRIKIQREVKTDRKHACHHKHSRSIMTGWLVGCQNDDGCKWHTGYGFLST